MLAILALPINVGLTGTTSPVFRKQVGLTFQEKMTMDAEVTSSLLRSPDSHPGLVLVTHATSE